MAENTPTRIKITIVTLTNPFKQPNYSLLTIGHWLTAFKVNISKENQQDQKSQCKVLILYKWFALCA